MSYAQELIMFLDRLFTYNEVLGQHDENCLELIQDVINETREALQIRRVVEK